MRPSALLAAVLLLTSRHDVVAPELVDVEPIPRHEASPPSEPPGDAPTGPAVRSAGAAALMAALVDELPPHELKLLLRSEALVPAARARARERLEQLRRGRAPAFRGYEAPDPPVHEHGLGGSCCGGCPWAALKLGDTRARGPAPERNDLGLATRWLWPYSQWPSHCYLRALERTTRLPTAGTLGLRIDEAGNVRARSAADDPLHEVEACWARRLDALRGWSPWAGQELELPFFFDGSEPPSWPPRLRADASTRFWPPKVYGPLGSARVFPVLASRHDALRSCHPSARGGSVQRHLAIHLGLSIASDGRTTVRAYGAHRPEEEETRACVERALHGLRFPKAAGSTKAEARVVYYDRGR